MEVIYRTKNLERICTEFNVTRRHYGKDIAKKIHLRIKQLKAAKSIDEIMLLPYPIGRCHPLHGDREGQYAMDLAQPHRLIFTKVGEDIQIARIEEIVDYH